MFCCGSPFQYLNFQKIFKIPYVEVWPKSKNPTTKKFTQGLVKRFRNRANRPKTVSLWKFHNRANRKWKKNKRYVAPLWSSVSQSVSLCQYVSLWKSPMLNCFKCLWSDGAAGGNLKNLTRCHHITLHLVSLSPWHLVTVSPCHHVTISHVTISPYHHAPLSPCHLVTTTSPWRHTPFSRLTLGFSTTKQDDVHVSRGSLWDALRQTRRHTLFRKT